MVISEKQLRKLLAVSDVRKGVADDFGIDECEVTGLSLSKLQPIVDHADWWFFNYTNTVVSYAPQDAYEPNPIHIYGNRGIYCVAVVGCPSMYFDTLRAARKYGDEQIKNFFVDEI